MYAFGVVGKEKEKTRMPKRMSFANGQMGGVKRWGLKKMAVWLRTNLDGA